MRSCNYNPAATKDNGSCKPAKDGFDCSGNKLAAGTDGATFFIRTKQPMKLSKSLSHAEVDLPENFEVGFDITPQKTPLKSWSNIIHFTATGKVCRTSSGPHEFFIFRDYQRTDTGHFQLWYRILSSALYSGVLDEAGGFTTYQMNFFCVVVVILMFVSELLRRGRQSSWSMVCWILYNT